MDKYIFLHVPKTGGTSVRTALRKRAKLCVAEHYYGLKSSAQKADVIYGHFKISTYANMFPHAKLITVVREPIEQIISNFLHYKRAQNTRFEPGIGRLPPGLNFVEFYRHPKMLNYQSQFFDTVDIEDFYVVGITERYNDFLDQLELKCGWKIGKLPHLNPSMAGRPVPTPEQIAEIKELYSKDYGLYEKAKKKAKVTTEAPFKRTESTPKKEIRVDLSTTTSDKEKGSELKYEPVKSKQKKQKKKKEKKEGVDPRTQE
jgi:hypothetical protein